MLRIHIASLLLWCVGVVQAAEPQVLPPPRPLPAPPVVVLPDPSVEFIRDDPRAVWQNYGPNQLGLFRPVVVQSPYASFYRDTGTPFDFTYNYPREQVLRAVGTSYRPAWQTLPPPQPGWVRFYVPR